MKLLAPILEKSTKCLPLGYYKCRTTPLTGSNSIPMFFVAAAISGLQLCRRRRVPFGTAAVGSANLLGGGALNSIATLAAARGVAARFSAARDVRTRRRFRTRAVPARFFASIFLNPFAGLLAGPKRKEGCYFFILLMDKKIRK